MHVTHTPDGQLAAFIVDQAGTPRWAKAPNLTALSNASVAWMVCGGSPGEAVAISAAWVSGSHVVVTVEGPDRRMYLTECVWPPGKWTPWVQQGSAVLA